ncbi:MAG: PDZ domain-containing protein [Streptosporangiaceae bacterium]|nr:PDZ domain-containing protein [Streptosporangiaceae bacterium]
MSYSSHRSASGHAWSWHPGGGPGGTGRRAGRRPAARRARHAPAEALPPLYVTAVRPSSPAARQGIRPGDVIESVDGSPPAPVTRSSTASASPPTMTSRSLHGASPPDTTPTSPSTQPAQHPTLIAVDARPRNRHPRQARRLSIRLPLRGGDTGNQLSDVDHPQHTN